jgi:signal transduction histidine kinase
MRDDRFQSFLRWQVLLVLLLAASLGLFLAYASLRSPYVQPQLHASLSTAFALTAALIAALCGTRFVVEGRRFDLFLGGGFLTIALSWIAAGEAGRTLGWALVAAAPFAVGRIRRRTLALWGIVPVLAAALALLQVAAHGQSDNQLNGVLALQALLQLTCAVAYGERFRRHAEDLDQWLSLVATLTLFATLGLIFAPSAAHDQVARGDFLVLVAHSVLLVGLWRAMHASEFGRAVAEERARVAREIHDGLAQYLFTISTHAAMLESGADPAVALPRLKEAALAAQQEARYAILALSSASGRSPFDTALRRYVEVLTADGALEVELEIDPAIMLGPDEQIEIFRIVQEGLANARRHADARRAWVQIGERNNERYVRVLDDGEGFTPEITEGGQGLRNIRERAASIGGAISLRSAPGVGTSLEVVLRG